MPTVNRFLAVCKMLGLVFILMMPLKAFAGYYIETEPVPVVACNTCSGVTYVYHPCHTCYRHHYTHHRTYHHVYHRRSSYRVDMYYVWHMPPPPPCYSCGCGSCGGCYSSCGSCYSGCSHVYYEQHVMYSPPPSYYYTSNYDTATADFDGDP